MQNLFLLKDIIKLKHSYVYLIPFSSKRFLSMLHSGPLLHTGCDVGDAIVLISDISKNSSIGRAVIKNC